MLVVIYLKQRSAVAIIASASSMPGISNNLSLPGMQSDVLLIRESVGREE
jgi:hypothetical protein